MHSGLFLHSGFLSGGGLGEEESGIGFFGRAKLVLLVFVSSEPKSQKGLAWPRQPSWLREKRSSALQANRSRGTDPSKKNLGSAYSLPKPIKVKKIGLGRECF